MVKIQNASYAPNYHNYDVYYNFSTPVNRSHSPPHVLIHFDPAKPTAMYISWEQSYLCERLDGPPEHPEYYTVNVTALGVAGTMTKPTTDTYRVNATDDQYISFRWPNTTVGGRYYIIGIASNEPNATLAFSSVEAPFPPTPPAESIGYGWFISFGIVILIGAAVCLAFKWQQRRRNGDGSEYASLIDPEVA